MPTPVSLTDTSTNLLWSRLDLYPTTFRRELDRVRQEVQDDLAHLPLIRLNLASTPGPLPDQSQSAIQRRREMEGGEFELHPPGCDLGRSRMSLISERRCCPEA